MSANGCTVKHIKNVIVWPAPFVRKGGMLDLSTVILLNKNKRKDFNGHYKSVDPSEMVRPTKVSLT